MDVHEAEVWITEMIRFVSSTEVGDDEYTARNLFSKHLNVIKEVKSFETTLDNLHTQYEQLTDENLRSEAQGFLINLEDLMNELITFTFEREKMLSNTVKISTLINSISDASQWILEKKNLVCQLFDLTNLDDFYLLQHRLEVVQKEMVSQAGNVAMINQMAKELVNELPDSSLKDQVMKQTQTLGRSWDDLCDLLDQREDQLQMAENIHQYYLTCSETILKIETKVLFIFYNCNPGLESLGF